MAAPHASGLAALLMSRLGDLATPENVEARLESDVHEVRLGLRHQNLRKRCAQRRPQHSTSSPTGK